MAEAIIFAMIASFILSRTLTPTMAAFLLGPQVEASRNPDKAKRPGIFTRFQAGFEKRIERFRNSYRILLERLGEKPKTFAGLYVSHYAIAPVIDIYADVEGRDLGAVSTAIQRIIDEMQPKAPKGSTVTLAGQSATMWSAYAQLLLGLGLSVVLI